MARPLPVQKTSFPKVERKWYLVDVADKPLGRLATRISLLLQGKMNLLGHHTLIMEISLLL